MDLIADFASVVGEMGADPLFLRWGGVALTSCLLGRRVYTSILHGKPLYGHLFVMFVAPSGFGKSNVITCIKKALLPFRSGSEHPSGSPQVVCAPRKITFPRIIHALGACFSEERATQRSLGIPTTQCYALIADEIGSLMGGEARLEDMQDLSAIWDMEQDLAKETVGDMRRGSEVEAIDYYMTMILGAQPRWLEEALPLNRFSLGTPARTHFVLPCGPKIELELSQETESDTDRLQRALMPTMRRVARVRGRTEFSPAAFDALQAWSKADAPGRGGGSIPWTGIMEGYGNRRVEHCGKLSLLFACARGRDSVTEGDFRDAQNLLWDTEDQLGKIVHMVGANPNRARDEQVLEWVRDKGEVSEPALRAFMANFVDTRFVGVTLDELEKSGRLKNVGQDKFPPRRRFVIGEKE